MAASQQYRKPQQQPQQAQRPEASSRPPSAIMKPDNQVDVVLEGKNAAALVHSPESIFFGASQLKLSAQERDMLMKEPDPNDIEILPHNGGIYLPFYWYAELLTKTFGPGQWCFVNPDVEPKLDPERNIVYVNMFLYVRGLFVGAGIGEGRIFESDWGQNKTVNRADSVKAAISEALHAAMKVSLVGGFIRLWDPKFVEKWREDHAVIVQIKQSSNTVKELWRRRDRPRQFKNEVKVVYDAKAPVEGADKGEKTEKKNGDKKTDEPADQKGQKAAGAVKGGTIKPTHWKALLGIAVQYGVTEDKIIVGLKEHFKVNAVKEITEKYDVIVDVVENICKKLTADAPIREEKENLGV